MTGFTIKDLAFLKAMRISIGDPELATQEEAKQCLMGQKYWDTMERTAARVATWPEWKTGTTRKGKRQK